ncbi:MAG: ankyrin repeat domain-containing protein [Candidatus Hydrogenedentes bacterium]|nr:ankyrin repeat domain-containing protein [Candidatus Hydrogenedentota bacterium]
MTKTLFSRCSACAILALGLAGCGPGVETKGEESIYMMAARGEVGLVREGLVGGFDVNTPDAEGRTLLHYAVAGEQPETVEYLIAQYRANPRVPDMDGNTAVDLAQEIGNQEVLEVFYSEGILE